MALALFAGQGELPGLVVAACRARGEPVVLCEMEGVEVSAPGAGQRLSYRLETLGTLISELHRRGVDRVVFAGAMTRPSLDMARVDAATAPILARLQPVFARGDDALLREIVAIFEEAGFAVVGVHEVAPELLPKVGVLTQAGPDAALKADAARGAEVVAAMGAADIGQACVVAGGQVLAVEAIPGTAWMLRSLMVPEARDEENPVLWAADAVGDMLGDVADWLSGPEAPRSGASSRDPALPPGGILYKAPKPGQERRIDLPVIGPETVTLGAAVGLDGIVTEAGGVMVIDRPRCVALADRLGLVLWVRG
ncbi:LpxI family protein [Aestuariibius insulae]|uniref:LpxI family protein n=1 Tax=Aestuariibius insulae TaxID=2058287 RepID=UPI00345EAC77